jgi:hypothetical protein
MGEAATPWLRTDTSRARRNDGILCIEVIANLTQGAMLPQQATARKKIAIRGERVNGQGVGGAPELCGQPDR